MTRLYYPDVAAKYFEDDFHSRFPGEYDNAKGYLLRLINRRNEWMGRTKLKFAEVKEAEEVEDVTDFASLKLVTNLKNLSYLEKIGIDVGDDNTNHLDAIFDMALEPLELTSLAKGLESGLLKLDRKLCRVDVEKLIEGRFDSPFVKTTKYSVSLTL